MDFIKKMLPYYEVIIYTASLAKYADPLMDILDDQKCCSKRLFREDCTFYQETYVKDLSELGRDLRDVIIIDNSPAAYAFQPENALPSISWYGDRQDTQLYDFIPFLIELSRIDDVREILRPLSAETYDNEVNIAFGMKLVQEMNAGKQYDQYQPQREVKRQNFIEDYDDLADDMGDGDSEISDRSTPHVTLPDMEQESMIFSPGPIHMGSYNREKKLIGDVSHKNEKLQLNMNMLKSYND